MAEDKAPQNESSGNQDDVDEAVVDATSDTLKVNTEAEADPKLTEGQRTAADS